ncbi:MAG: hypothetical protein V4484_16240 [Pseudomonadota bacterium]
MLDEKYFLKAFQNPMDRARATHELAQFGELALPLLQAILNGSARNEFGVPYRNLGMPIDCALVTIQLLGFLAAHLEALVRVELANGHPYAESALAAIVAQPGSRLDSLHAARSGSQLL